MYATLLNKRQDLNAARHQRGVAHIFRGRADIRRIRHKFAEHREPNKLGRFRADFGRHPSNSEPESAIGATAGTPGRRPGHRPGHRRGHVGTRRSCKAQVRRNRPPPPTSRAQLRTHVTHDTNTEHDVLIRRIGRSSGCCHAEVGRGDRPWPARGGSSFEQSAILRAPETQLRTFLSRFLPRYSARTHARARTLASGMALARTVSAHITSPLW